MPSARMRRAIASCVAPCRSLEPVAGALEPLAHRCVVGAGGDQRHLDARTVVPPASAPSAARWRAANPADNWAMLAARHAHFARWRQRFDRPGKKRA